MRTTVDLDPHLLRRLRSEARARGVSVKELLTTVLQRGLAEPVAAKPRYRCPTYSMGAPVSGVNLDKAMEIAASLEDEEIVRKIALRK